MVEKFAQYYEQTVLSFPRVTLLVLLIVLSFFAVHIPDFKLDASSDSLLLEKDRDLRKYQEVIEDYRIREFVFLAVSPSGDLLSAETLDTIKKLRRDLLQIESIQSVITLLDVPLVYNVDGTLADAAKNYRTLKSADVDIERARKELTTSPIYRDLIVSHDGKTTALQIFLRYFPDYRDVQRDRNRLVFKQATDGLTAEEAIELAEIEPQYEALKAEATLSNHTAIADIRAVMARYDDQVTLHLGGLPMIVDDMVTFIGNDLVNFSIGVFVFLVIMLSIIFRELRWVVLPLASCFYAGTLMIGLLSLVGWKVTIISSNFMSLMLIITMSMNIHLIVRYRELFRDNPDADQKSLVLDTLKHMVRPCFYTAITTMIAFASLMVSNIKPVIDFGWIMVIGLSVVFLTSFLLFPAALVLTKIKPLKQTEEKNYPFTEALGRFTEHHGNAVLVISVLVAIIGGIGITRLEVENSFISFFHEDTEIYQGLKLIDEKLGGTTPLDIVLQFPTETDAIDDPFDDDDLAELFGEIESEKSDSWFTPFKVDRIKAVHDYLESLPEVGKVLSLASVVRVAETLNGGKEFDAFQLNVIYKRLPLAIRYGAIDPYISIEKDQARVSVRIIDSLPDLRRKALIERIEHALRTELGLQENEFELTGLLVLYNNFLQSLFKSQILTLGAVMIGILLMLWILFRSFSIAVIGVLPNVLAATTILGFMGWMGIPLDVMTITIAAVTIGIAVDDCIHYLYRFKAELPRLGDDIKTMHYCHANIAKAAFYTTVTITLGFSILILSNFIPTVLFGLLTAVAMIVALLAALTLMPKLLLVFKPLKENSRVVYSAANEGQI